MTGQSARDHGGDLGAAIARFGPGDWLDLSTGINPVPYPLPALSADAWTRLPDTPAAAACGAAARATLAVPDTAALTLAPGASALIRALPRLAQGRRVAIPGPTYNEHAAAFRAEGWQVEDRPGPGTAACVIVNPNNPTGRGWERHELRFLAEAIPLLIVDESFMDLTPERSLIPDCGAEGVVVLRSFGKFWGLAGLRLGFAISGPRMAARLADALGPWPVAGPALAIGAAALADTAWAKASRKRIAADAQRLTRLAEGAGWRAVGGAGLFTTFDTPDAAAAQTRLAQAHIWSRIFPYSPRWLRLGLPGREADWTRLATALA
ncbi:MAG: threonine-phosphate decarboxylase CobD [Pseudomonadota bacterium]